MDPAISERISIYRYVMIFGIVVLHAPPYVPLEATGDGAFAFVKAFFSHGLFRATVPVLTCISGYLLFRAALDRRYDSLIRKKVSTLLVPLILWNAPLVAALCYIQATGLLDHDFSLTLFPFDAAASLNAVLGITAKPVNYPLGFLRDLFVLALLSPVFGVLLRRAPWTGLAIVCGFFWFNQDGLVVMRNTMAINFYIGGMAAVMAWNLKRLDRLAVPFGVVLVAACAAIVLFEIHDRRWFQIVSPLLVWPLAAGIVGTAVGRRLARLSRHSFFIFLGHGPVLLAFWLIYQKAFAGVPYVVFWLAAPVLVAITCQIAHRLARGYAPAVARLALGSR